MISSFLEIVSLADMHSVAAIKISVKTIKANVRVSTLIDDRMLNPMPCLAS